ncbi:uncharacterized protein N7484_009896 [Penicillium longicatenatum]|uniref:uncharacterized protein n=1 Tax=Penicillium longicatenatum TaxID=1561947 RepID=UPI002547E952|nr:uncharacterized protein N7484_009896 [Penicillium longicatenatum]KAJ5636583.1 hypothetical protein N7484_009896 [Penicillium longicatenatum]
MVAEIKSSHRIMPDSPLKATADAELMAWFNTLVKENVPDDDLDTLVTLYVTETLMDFSFLNLNSR